jgi:hypothetical protein
MLSNVTTLPVPVTARSKAQVCGHSAWLGLWVRSPPGGMDVCVLLVEASATSWSLFQPTDCDASLRMIQEPQE